MAASVFSQGILWEPAAKDLWGAQYANHPHGLTTNHNWARTGTWGLYEDHLGDPYPTTIRVSTNEPIYAMGGWFNTNPDGQAVGFLFQDLYTANEPGYVIPGYGAMYPGDNPSFGHQFSGIVNPDGFTSVVLTGTLEVNEENNLEGGVIFGADNFLFGITPGFNMSIAGDLNDDGFVGITDLNLVLSAWNQNVNPGDPLLGDPSGDGFVGIADLNVVLGNWNAGTPPSGTANIPEPASLVLLGLTGLGILSRTRPLTQRGCIGSHP